MNGVSVWEATVGRAENRPALVGDQQCDAVIIGGGFTGLSAAYHLQQKNCRTIVLETDKVGSGGSGRNGGQILTGFIHSMGQLAKDRGLETARQMLHMSLDSIDLIEQLVNEHKINCAFERNGHLVAAYKPSHLDWLKEEQEVLSRDFGYDVEVVDKAGLKGELATDFYHGGSIDPKSAIFHPLNYVLGLAEAVERLGGSIFEHSKAINIEWPSHNKVVITTDSGTVTASHLVIATNAYSDGLHKQIMRSIVPVESIMIATEPLPEELASELIKKNRGVFDTKHLLYYFRKTPDNRIAFGGSGRAASKRDELNRFRNLQQGLVTVFPELTNVTIDYQWSGKVGFTREMLPYIGQLQDGTHFAFGYAGHGTAMSTLMGKCLAENILLENKGVNPFEKDELKPIPLYSQHAKAVGLMKYYFRLKDLIS